MRKTPKVIWQTWKTKNVPPNLSQYRKKWLESHPDYQHILLDDQDLRDLIQEYFPEYLDAYDSFTQNIERVDFARYAILYAKGGVYVDLDTVPLKRVDKYVNLGKPVIGCEPSEHAKKIYSREKVLCNAVMISPPGYKIWRKLMDFIISNYERNYKPVETTGPMAMTKLYESDPTLFKDVLITHPCVFYPLTGQQTVSSECNLKDSTVAHIWTNTWVEKNWWDNPLLWNARYWVWSLLIFYVGLFVFCGFENESFNN